MPQVVPGVHKLCLHWKGHEALEQAAQRSTQEGVTISGGIQKSCRCGVQGHGLTVDLAMLG